MHKTPILALVLILGCTTTQPAPPAPESQFRNLQVFPKDIPRDDLIDAMKGFTRGLGVKCNYCHVVTATEPKEELDFPNDSKEEKRIARVMIQMTSQINGTWLPRVEAAEDHEEAKPADAPPSAPVRVACWTCHRGMDEPEAPPPPPPAR